MINECTYHVHSTTDILHGLCGVRDTQRVKPYATGSSFYEHWTISKQAYIRYKYEYAGVMCPACVSLTNLELLAELNI